MPTILSFDATFVELRFKSDYSVTKSGFEIAYKVLSRKGYIITHCLSSDRDKIMNINFIIIL